MITFFMVAAGLCYVGASLSYLFNGQVWMFGTMALYAGSIGTIYMAGTQ